MQEFTDILASKLIKDLAEYRERLVELRKGFMETTLPQGSDGQVRRVADRFALVAAAGKIATSMGLDVGNQNQPHRALGAQAGHPSRKICDLALFHEIPGQSGQNALNLPSSERKASKIRCYFVTLLLIYVTYCFYFLYINPFGNKNGNRKSDCYT